MLKIKKFISLVTCSSTLLLSTNTNALWNSYLECYGKKPNGDVTSLWAQKDGAYYVVPGVWSSIKKTAMLVADKSITPPFIRSLCIQNLKKDPSLKFVEAKVSTRRALAYTHDIWYTDKNDTESKINRIVAFGDSLSDNGNIFSYSLKTLPKDGYWQGRFTNGYTWVEFLAQKLELPLINNAEGGAGSQFTKTLMNIIPPADLDELSPPLEGDYFFIPSIERQVDNYLEFANYYSNDNEQRQILFTLLIGGNDYLNDWHNPHMVTDSIRRSLEKLIAVGGRHFVIPKFPDISYTPRVQKQGAQAIAAMKRNTVLHNALLEAQTKVIIDEYKAKGISITVVMPNIDLEDFVKNQKKYNIDNLKEPCFTGSTAVKSKAGQICHLAQAGGLVKDDPTNHYMFWDDIHPTAKVHCILGVQMYSAVKEALSGEKISMDYKQCETVSLRFDKAYQPTF